MIYLYLASLNSAAYSATGIQFPTGAWVFLPWHGRPILGSPSAGDCRFGGKSRSVWRDDMPLGVVPNYSEIYSLY
jgi:hypothetical protein